MVKYTYDAWGNHGIEVLDSTCETLANLNPFRYRGYYYDTETELYFLKTRYYDPEIGRFMTIDGISYASEKAINGLNLYVYCKNNPVMYIDSNGTDAILVTAYGKGGLKVVGHTALLFEYNGEWCLTQYTGVDKSSARISLDKDFDKEPKEILDEYFGYENNSIFPIKFSGYQTVYLEGDYSSVYDIADSYNGTNYGGYNLIFNNCLDYVQQLLRTTNGEGRDAIIQEYHKISFIMIPALYPIGTKIASAISKGVQTMETIINDVYSSINAWWRSLW